MLPVVSSWPSRVEAPGASTILPLDTAVPAPLRERAVMLPTVLAWSNTMAAPASLRVAMSARPVTASLPLVLTAPLATSARLSTLEAAKSAAPVTLARTAWAVKAMLPKVLPALSRLMS